MTFPLTICRACGHPEATCNCTADTEQVLIVPDATAALVREYARSRPDLVNGDYEDHATAGVDPLSVLCYPAAEAWYHLQDCEPDVYCLNWSDVDLEYGGTHWYLRESGGDRRWIDVGLPLTPPIKCPPFEAGTRRGFITGDAPSKRAQEILEAIGKP